MNSQYNIGHNIEIQSKYGQSPTYNEFVNKILKNILDKQYKQILQQPNSPYRYFVTNTGLQCIAKKPESMVQQVKPLKFKKSEFQDLIKLKLQDYIFQYIPKDKYQQLQERINKLVDYSQKGVKNASVYGGKIIDAVEREIQSILIKKHVLVQDQKVPDIIDFLVLEPNKKPKNIFSMLLNLLRENVDPNYKQFQSSSGALRQEYNLTKSIKQSQNELIQNRSNINQLSQQIINSIKISNATARQYKNDPLMKEINEHGDALINLMGRLKGFLENEDDQIHSLYRLQE